MKTKDFALQVKDLSEDGTFEGYASTFGGAPDSYGDIVVAGAFSDSLAEHAKLGTMPALLWGHEHSRLPIGDWLELKEDRKGLYGKGKLDLEDPEGARVHRALKAKRVRGLSIGYETLQSRPDEKRLGVNVLEKIDLWEVSVVNFPANARAGVTAIKSGRMEDFARRLRDGEPMPVKEFEDILREVGVPKAMAVQIASVGYAKAIRSDSEGVKANVLADLQSAVSAFLPTRT